MLVLVLVLVQMQVQVEEQVELREVTQPAAEPNQPEDGGNLLRVLVLVLALVQTQVQVEEQVEEGVRVQQKSVSLAVVVVKQHTAELNELANGCKQEQGEGEKGA